MQAYVIGYDNCIESSSCLLWSAWLLCSSELERSESAILAGDRKHTGEGKEDSLAKRGWSFDYHYYNILVLEFEKTNQAWSVLNASISLYFIFCIQLED